MTLAEIVSRFQGAKRTGHGYMALCPAHGDKNPSLSISEKSGKILLCCHAGCEVADILSSVGLDLKDLFTDSQPESKPGRQPRTVVCEYSYRDLSGTAKLKKVRYFPKSFAWFHEQGEQWKAGRNGRTAALYMAREMRDDDHVYLVEGEKDVNSLLMFQLPAVSPPDGAKTKWLPEYTEYFRGKTVYLIQDNDEPGKAFASSTAAELYGTARMIKILDLSKIWENIPAHGDVSDLTKAMPDWKDKLTGYAEQENPFDLDGDENYGIIRLSEVRSTKTEWLWFPYLPRGKISLMTADPGTGKTFFSLYLAAQLSTGRPFFGEQSPYREAQTVVYQTAEDGLEDTIKPRLEPMSPNFERILMIDETQQGLSLSDERIEQTMKRYSPALMIFDPLQAYLGADVDMHRANEVRPVLAQIGRLAEKYNCSVLFIMHQSKMTQASALHRALGSIDIPAVARSMLIMARDPDDPTRRIICHEKSSLAANGKSMLFRIEPQLGGITFCGYSDLKADDVLNERRREKPSVKLDDAAAQLDELIGEKRWAELSEIVTLQNALGISRATLYRAKQQLQLDDISTGFGKDKRSFWIGSEIDREKFKSERMNE